MADAITSETQSKQEWLEKFWAERQKEAEAAGMHVIQYMAQADGGILKPTIIKILRHANAHPKTCPADCVFQRSSNELKKNRIANH